MTPDEWEATAMLIEHWWASGTDPWTEAKATAYRIGLAEFEMEQIHGALQSLKRKGGTWRPSVAEIVAELASDPTLPTWPEAWRLIERALRRGPERTLDALDGEHRYIVAFVATQGPARLCNLPVYDPEWGQVELRRLGEQWTEFVQRAQDRERHGLALDGGSRSEGGTLHRIEPAGLLRRAS